MTVTIQDDSGLAVPARITQTVDGGREVAHEFCGATAKPVAIDPSAAVKVVRYHGSCDDDSTDPTRFGTWTNGTVTATFATTP